MGVKQSGINTKAGIAETPDQVEGRLAESKISRECARPCSEEGSRVDDTVRIAKESEARNSKFILRSNTTENGQIQMRIRTLLTGVTEIQNSKQARIGGCGQIFWGVYAACFWMSQ